VSTVISVVTSERNQYVPRDRNELHTIFERHFSDFCEHYDEKYSATYGRYRLERIQQLGERFCTCGDYLQGVARIRCTNPECGHDYFRPFSCKGFYLCPSCSQKRTILFAEHLTNEVLLRLPHRQFVFTLPKALRPFFRHDRRLFAGVSRLIYRIIDEFYAEAAGRPLLTGMVIAHQTFGDMLRWNPHFHAIVLEGGFDDEGTFFFIPFSGLQSMVAVFRRRMITLLVQRELLNEDFARNLLSWKHSGFSIDNSVRILDQSSQESLAEYIARPPISLKKIRYEPFNRSDSPKAISQTRQGGRCCFTPRTPSISSRTFTCLRRLISSRSSPSTSRRGDYSSPGAMVSMPLVQKGDGARCRGLRNEHRRGGEPPTNAA
jgi:hypothetical protein